MVREVLGIVFRVVCRLDQLKPLQFLSVRISLAIPKCTDAQFYFRQRGKMPLAWFF